MTRACHILTLRLKSMSTSAAESLPTAFQGTGADDPAETTRTELERSGHCFPGPVAVSTWVTA